jgi:hypothetical protein
MEIADPRCNLYVAIKQAGDREDYFRISNRRFRTCVAPQQMGNDMLVNFRSSVLHPMCARLTKYDGSLSCAC